METIDKETALREFERWVEGMGLVFVESDMDNDDKKDFSSQKDRVISAIQNGSLIVDDDCQFVFTPRRKWDGEPITFYEPSGSALMAMDYKKKDKDVGKLYNSMADMTKTTAATFAKMKLPDLNVCIAITVLFLA